MKRFPQVFALSIVFLFVSVAFGQEPADPPPDAPADRLQLLRDLGLSQAQVRQIRLINQEVRAKRQAARQRMGEAGRDLDQAIYADSADEALFAQRLKNFQDAQAEMAKINFENELEIRKVLTPEQLTRFREIRQTFQRQRQQRIRNRGGRQDGAPRRALPDADRPSVKDHRPVRQKSNR